MDESNILKPGESIKPKIEKENVNSLVEENYGLKCSTVTELNGYDDKNYKLIVEGNFANPFLSNVSRDGYVLKVMNSKDSRNLHFVEGQNALMLFLINSGFCCPKPIQTKHGSYYFVQQLVSGGHVVRLLEFVSGKVLIEVPPNEKLLFELGKYLATLDMALKNFHHPSYMTYKSIWMLDNVPEISHFLFAVEDSYKKSIIQEIIDEFIKKVMPVKDTLEKGILHGDFNEQNIIVRKVDDEWKITGILDFGDSQLGNYLFELAVAMAYAMIFAKNIEAGGHFLAGYSEIRTIPDREFSVLKLCIEARLCQSFVLGTYSILQDPTNSYILASALEGWKILLKLREQSEEQILSLWQNSIKNYNYWI